MSKWPSYPMIAKWAASNDYGFNGGNPTVFIHNGNMIPERRLRRQEK
jgi:hypothetical protein